MLRRGIIQKKKGQVEFGVMIVITIIIGLILFAPIIMRMVGTITGQFFITMNNSYPSAVAPASDAVDTVTNFFDYLIIIAMLVNIIILFISAWFIDTNPVFLILYIMFSFILFLFLPSLLDAVDTVWVKMEAENTHDLWEGNDLNLTFTDFIRRNMMVFSLIILSLTGILIYAKFKITQGRFT